MARTGIRVADFEAWVFAHARMHGWEVLPFDDKANRGFPSVLLCRDGRLVAATLIAEGKDGPTTAQRSVISKLDAVDGVTAVAWSAADMGEIQTVLEEAGV